MKSIVLFFLLDLNHDIKESVQYTKQTNFKGIFSGIYVAKNILFTLTLEMMKAPHKCNESEMSFL